MPTEHHEKARNAITNFEHLIDRHKNKSIKHLDDILDRHIQVMLTPSDISKLDFEDLFALSFAYVLHDEKDKFDETFQYAKGIFQAIAMNGLMELDTLQKYDPHISVIHRNLDIFYEVLKNRYSQSE